MAKQAGQVLKTGISEKKVNNSSNRSYFFKTEPAALYLSDGKVFKGRQPVGQKTSFAGEVVFNTGMTGYVESLTDPSYTGQILVFTYPLIGNYGVQENDVESGRIQVTGVIISELAQNWSHQQAKQSLQNWLKSQNVPVLCGVDTRALTKHLRSLGVMPGIISAKPVRRQAIQLQTSLTAAYRPKIYNPRSKKMIILVDCGAKGNILQSLLRLKLKIKQVPADYDYTNEDYDGVLYSNGPGDPQDYRQAIAIARQALKKDKPIFGICLGSQLLALAAGAQTYKLRFGHRGHNQPCLQTAEGRCFITSQNHGYAINDKSLPADWQVSFRNLNDQSVEGIEHKSKPFFAVQFHPEASPGPTDTGWLFDEFYSML